MSIEDPQDRPVVVIAVDNSPQAENAFNWYINEAHQRQHKVLIAHCIQQVVVMGDMTGSAYTSILEQEKRESEKCKDKFSHLLKNHQIGGEFVSAIHARPEDWLVDICQLYKASLLVLGTRGQNAVRRTILGSVSTSVLHHAHCPVAICHMDERKEHH